MQETRRIELVFPRSGQVVPIQVPVEVFELVQVVNQMLLSFIFAGSVPSSCFDRLTEAPSLPA